MELKHRLPGLWALSEGLEVAAWKLKMIARLTSGLSVEAAAYVDAQLAPILATRGGPTIEKVVAGGGRAVPPRAGDRGRGRPGRPPGTCGSRTRASGEWAGTSWLDATADTVDLTKFGDLVADIARRLGEAGDPDTLEQRRAKAIGIVADVHAGADLDDLIAALVAAPSRRAAVRRIRGSGPGTCSSTSTSPPTTSTGTGGVATVEGLGAVTIERIEAWLARHTAAGGRARVTPVHRPGPAGRGGPARPAALDGRTGEAARPAVRVPLLPDPCPRLRPRPHHPVRPTR